MSFADFFLHYNDFSGLFRTGQGCPAGKNREFSVCDVFFREEKADNHHQKEVVPVIDQVKIGSFLKELRKEKGKTQEEIASMLGTTSRSVSRWENGNTMPDLTLLVELADYYEVDIREIIDGERKAENVDKETKETLLRIADYADKQKKQAIIRAIILFGMEMICCGLTIASGLLVLRSKGTISAGYAVIPAFIMVFFSVALLINAKSYTRKVTRKSDKQE